LARDDEIWTAIRNFPNMTIPYLFTFPAFTGKIPAENAYICVYLFSTEEAVNQLLFIKIIALNGRANGKSAGRQDCPYQY
jgi:hypothetical protein